METNQTKGHLAALLTVLIWGTTFISTKVLLEDFQPVEILFFRFLLGLAALYLVLPRPLRGTTPRQELTFAGAGLCGICLYYLLENMALLSRWFLGQEGKLRATFLVGFAVAMGGIALISLGGGGLQLNPVGDLLALLAALVWAFYSILTRKISTFGYPTILTTRRVFLYGILWMVPALFLFDFRWDLGRLTDPTALGNLLFLGLGASALCFVTWNVAVKRLGALKTSIYIYLVPVITVAASVVILDEPFTWRTGVGTALTLAGLLLSEGRVPRLPGRGGHFSPEK